MSEFVLEMSGISKSFPGVKALQGVGLRVRPGTVHSLMGENGAGKSTLMKILAGIYSPDEGTIVLDGTPVTVADPRAALALGVSMIHQELSSVPELTVAENIFLGREPRNRYGLVSRKIMVRRTREIFDRWEIRINPRSAMKQLSIAQAQMVEIAKAISFGSRIIVMDEPTSAITEREVGHLHRMIGQLREAGTAIIYITHKMDEVFAISDDVTIFRDGQWVATKPAAELDRDKLIALMVGRELTDLFPKEEAPIGDVVLRVSGLNRGSLVRDVSFEVRRGEILGIAGLMGAGRTEVLETIFGVHPAESGTVEVNGRQRRIREPRDAIKAGLALLTEDRKRTGIMGVLSVRDNMSVAALPRYSPQGMLRRGSIDEACEDQRRRLALKTPSLNQLIQNLSGGNQQKVLLSRWLLTLPDVLMIDEPTRGIDVGAKSEIHRLMSALAQQGKAIVMVSSEMPEVLGMSDRVLVMCEGRITGEVPRSEATQERIMHFATATAHHTTPAA
ncbi:sugar ABC transporter ATP-binding protein [Kineosporia sp. R_H_3]|uniref:sugar ABC transporter ATP-binding protein n=1 Tax=Kineosporia sp. R_H_3 TaxID=1961848 RepID=UPI000B4B017D|nr:sugar ABC transporter ATP-binding protein [Kineosporia sp. R_H_3]